MTPPQPIAESAVKAEFTTLYEGCSEWLYGYLFSLLRNHESAHEVLQDTARTCWEKFDQYHRGTEFRAWACRIAFYKAQNLRKKLRRTPSSFSDLFFDVIDEESLVMADKMDARALALVQCLEKLTPADRKLLEERYHQDFDVAELAKQAGRSPQTVYRSLARIHESLFQCINRTLEEEGAS